MANSNDYLIAGLGNPGAKYAGTRHNVGFMCVEALARKHGIEGKGETKMQAIVGRGAIGKLKVLIAQPLTYMNRSGEAVARLQQYYKIPLDHILVVFDDSALPFGKIRFRSRGSAGSHNGMKSIIERLGSEDFPRLRIGIGEPDSLHRGDLADFVLARFTPEEEAQLPKIMAVCLDAVEHWLEHGIESAMNRYNSLEIPISQ